MNMEQGFSRMTDEAHEPTEEEIISFLGEQAKDAWLEIRRFIKDRYELVPETIFYGKKYGWTIRYRKSGKTLCSLFPARAHDGSWLWIRLLTTSDTDDEKKLLQIKRKPKKA